jgi:hypothetical protein
MARRLLPLVAAVLLVGALAAPARAIGSFGPPVTVWDPFCDFTAFNVDLARDTSEVAHGFADLWACNNTGDDFRIHYFEGSGTTWTREPTPYRGFVIAVAWDATGTYLLYVDHASFNLRITKRLTDGTYTGGRELASGRALDSNLSQGDVVASGGRWWAVWREHVAPDGGPGNEGHQSDLFQAYTIGGPFHPRHRITTHPDWDRTPTLALTPGSIFPLVLVWERAGEEFGPPSPSDLRRATGSAAGTWSSSLLATAGFTNTRPDVQVAGTTTYVTWHRDGRTVVADNGGGSFVSHTFNTLGNQNIGFTPRIAISAGNVFVGWTTGTSPRPRAFVAKRVGTTWTGTFASPVAARTQVLAGVAPAGGLATAVILSLGSRIYATNEQ